MVKGTEKKEGSHGKPRKKMTLGVREFAMPTLRTGSLGSTNFSALPIDLGNEIHEVIQNRLELLGNYQAEYPLRTVLEGALYELKIRGRCDGYFLGTQPILEEIKSSFGIAALKEALHIQADHPYILQTKMYGYLYYLKTTVIPVLRLRLVDTRSLDESILDIPFDPLVFEVWVKQRVAQIEASLEQYRTLMKARKGLSGRLYFPFATPRLRQKELVESVRSCLEQGKNLLLQAPTGLGKTAGVLFPALQHGLSQGRPVVYIAPKNSQFTAAVDLASMFQKSRIGLKVLVLTSKAKACRQEEVLCQASSCVYAKDYYDKVDGLNLVGRDTKKHLWDYQYFRKLSEAFEVCPYELGMERIREADLIICDYNYIFSPRANFFDRYLDPILPMKKPILVIDEAHNLYERVIDNYSPEIKLSALKAFLVQAATGADKRFASLVTKAIQLMETLNPKMAQAKVELSKEDVKELLDQSLALMTSRWGESGLPGADEPLFQFFTLWFDLSEMLSSSRETVPLIYKRENGDETLKAQCIDPADLIAPIYLMFESVIAFSATLKPFEFYRPVSGFTPDTEAIEFESPFPREHKKIMIIPQVETNYRERNRHYERIATIINRIAAIKEGAYLIFFSSYQFLKSVQEILAVPEEWSVFAQSAAMGEAQIRFVRDVLRSKGTRLILAVQGGSLSEGIDFKGEGIAGVFIVGPAVPTASFERRLMQEHYEKRYGNGRAFAYIYPSMTKSVQAAGRIVRDETERGVIVLMDPRFLEKGFQEAMPRDWYASSARELVPKQILAEVVEFWRTDEAGSEKGFGREGHL
ncbi:MAG: ATP-dependent DNA helicase [Chitinophagaceae bacterium]|nr:ATP-dependent DNA helicase [Oligoflexus sp.]